MKSNYNLAIIKFLENRQLEVKDIDYLVNPSFNHQHNPMLMYGLEEWIDILHSLKGKVISIIPDYDADGVLSGTTARVGLSLLGFGDCYIYPPKVYEGYGLSVESIDSLLLAKPDTEVIITTDNGNSAHDGIAYAREKGIVVLVTDHHRAEVDPKANAVVNPNRVYTSDLEQYPFREISGTTVIYKVLLAYANKYIDDENIINQYRSLILLVGIATVSDVMPLLNENRYFVLESINMLKRFILTHNFERLQSFDDSPLGQFYRGVGLLIETLNFNKKLKYGLDVDTFGFLIGPILNSPRRMVGDSSIAFDLFNTTKEEVLKPQGSSVSDLLYEVNEQRKDYVKVFHKALRETVDGGRTRDVSPLHYTVFNSAIKAGVAGLLSGNFTNTYNLPSVSFSVDNDIDVKTVEDLTTLINLDTSGDFFMSGSARAPEGFDLYGMLYEIDESHPKLIESWGGHPQAAGVKIHSSNFEKFRSIFVGKLSNILTAKEELKTSDGVDRLPIYSEYVITSESYDECLKTQPKPDNVLELKVSNIKPIMQDNQIKDIMEFFDSLEPYGHCFSKAMFSTVFKLKDVKVFLMGEFKQHIKFTFPNGLAVIRWNEADLIMDDANIDKSFIVTGSLNINEFRGRKTLQLTADDLIIQ